MVGNAYHELMMVSNDYFISYWFMVDSCMKHSFRKTSSYAATVVVLSDDHQQQSAVGNGNG